MKKLLTILSSLILLLSLLGCESKDSDSHSDFLDPYSYRDNGSGAALKRYGDVVIQRDAKYPQTLMWQDNSDAKTIKKQWSIDHSYNTDGDTAASYCSNLVLATFDDWRVPTSDEMHILEMKNMNKNAHTLVNLARDDAYWTSTDSFGTTSRDCFQFSKNSGGIMFCRADTYRYVRCVRTMNN